MKKNDASRLWVQENLNKLSIRKALEQIQSTGRSLPCSVKSVSGQIVTVTFEVVTDTWTLPPVTIPISTSIYDWIPVQPGDKGITIPADVNISRLSGLGTEPPTLGINPANLSSLVFVPVSNAGQIPPGGDASMRVSQGPDGILCQTMDGKNSISIKSGAIVFIVGGVEVASFSANAFSVDVPQTNSSTIVASGNITAGSIDMENHVHQYSPGSGSPTNTAPPTG